ncbi:MAG: hypothetical protein M3N13_01095, partial [Candidatus Eremiobacteraeota bacterium]|nr:hypothetical protein [Candidatus Eremiobacteraeota bacterium]
MASWYPNAITAGADGNLWFTELFRTRSAAPFHDFHEVFAMNRVAFFYVLVFVLTGCAGSSGSVVPNAVTAAGATKAGSVALTITVPRPNAQSTVRHAAYISPSTQSVSV